MGKYECDTKAVKRALRYRDQGGDLGGHDRAPMTSGGRFSPFWPRGTLAKMLSFNANPTSGGGGIGSGGNAVRCNRIPVRVPGGVWQAR